MVYWNQGGLICCSLRIHCRFGVRVSPTLTPGMVGAGMVYWNQGAFNSFFSAHALSLWCQSLADSDTGYGGCWYGVLESGGG
ncbi:hypothetical protein [Vibrio methylphosphonaticus]|uniref:hypothetical protein n=1 Tax=Vibrio methylphosphonaticus TaxID=2946866 RepID=UPI00202A120A|nr:hypothetical protein [Vibrio methylphosphonaticus]MCL9775454.1 hypothetical protein [Vibrio methylphosphonaticus]